MTDPMARNAGGLRLADREIGRLGFGAMHMGGESGQGLAMAPLHCASRVSNLEEKVVAACFRLSEMTVATLDKVA